jgi:hypothetical protein
MKRKAPRRSHQPPTLVVRKLGREQAWGRAFQNGVIEVDPRLTGLGKLEILIHEYMHVQDWAMPEAEVLKRSRTLAKFLHKHRVRIIEAGDKLLP